MAGNKSSSVVSDKDKEKPKDKKKGEESGSSSNESSGSSSESSSSRSSSQSSSSSSSSSSCSSSLSSSSSSSSSNNDRFKPKKSPGRENRERSPPRPTRIHIGRLTLNVTRDHIHEIFSTYGAVKAVEFPMNRMQPHNGRGYAYVEFTKANEAENAMKHMDGGQIDGQQITVQVPLRPRPPLPRHAPPRRHSPPQYRRRSPLPWRRAPPPPPWRRAPPPPLPHRWRTRSRLSHAAPRRHRSTSSSSSSQ